LKSRMLPEESVVRLLLLGALLSSCSHPEAETTTSSPPAAVTSPPSAATPASSRAPPPLPSAPRMRSGAFEPFFDSIAPESEPSQWGRFAMTVVPVMDKDWNEECSISFTPNGGPRKPVFAVPYCGGSGPLGIGTIGATRRVGSVALPVTGPHGELHLFQIATARGGNAVPGFEAWIVRVDSTLGCDAACPGAVAREFGTNVHSDIVSVDAAPPRSSESTMLLVESPSTRTEKGVRYEINATAGLEVKEHELPLLAVTVKSKVRQVFEHVRVVDGFRLSNGRPMIDVVGGDSTVIDEDGPCDLTKLPLAGRVTLDVITWSNGDTSTKCVRIER
jgi:hypothetical protein